jgi:hypothetical protein
MTYRVKNWGKFQHYKKRKPPWIRLYRDLILDDPDFDELPGDDFKLLAMLWMVASEDETYQGILPDDRTVAYRLRLKKQEIPVLYKRLAHWVIPCEQDASIVQADCNGDATPETEAESDQRQRERDNARSNSKDEEEGGIFVIDDEVATKFDAEAYRKMPRNKWPTNRVVEEVSTIPRPDQSEHLPLKSPEANAVLAKIQEKWPDYPIDQAMVTASGIWTKFGEKLDVLKILEDAIFAWDPGRTIWEKNGVHGYLTSFFLNREKDVQKAPQAPSRGKGGVPHQSEATRPSLAVRLKRLDEAVRGGRQISKDWVDTWNEYVTDGPTWEDRANWNKIESFVYSLSDAGHVELNGRKIVDHSLPAEPRTPKELLEGDEAPDPEFVKKQIAQLTAMKGLEE